MGSRQKKIELPRPELNITAMMDLVLNLVTFFVLVANFAAAAAPGLTPPSPEKSVARVDENPNRIIINVLPDPSFKGTAGPMAIGGSEIAPGDMAGLSSVLRREVKISNNVEVYLRADRSIQFRQIEPIMMVIAGAGVKSFHMVALAPEDLSPFRHEP